MLFWTRAILCIGTVTVMAIQRLPSEPRLPAPSASALVGEACRLRPDLCAAAVTRGIGAIAHPFAVPEVRGDVSGHGKTFRRPAAHDQPVALGVRSLT